jgi:hypothetical protein
MVEREVESLSTTLCDRKPRGWSRTDPWAAKDGAPTFCVRDECEG